MIYSVKLTEKNRFIALHSVNLSLQMREIYRKKGGTVVPPSDFQSEGSQPHKKPPINIGISKHSSHAHARTLRMCAYGFRSPS